MLNVTPNSVMRNNFYLKPVFQNDHLNNFEVHDKAFISDFNNENRRSQLPFKPVTAMKADTALNMVKENFPLILLGIAITIFLK